MAHIRALEVKRQPLLNAAEPAALRQIQEEDQIKRYRSGQNAIATQEVDLDLHGIIKPAKDVDVVPPFLVVSPGLVVMNVDLVVVGTVQILVEVGLQNIVEHRELTPFLSAEGGAGIVLNTSPSRFPRIFVENHPCRPNMRAFKPGAKNGFHKRLAGFEVLAADRDTFFRGQVEQGWDIDREVGGAIARAAPDISAA